MLTKEIFAREFTFLMMHFRKDFDKDLDPEMQDRLKERFSVGYYKALSPILNDEKFIHACEIALTKKYFPSADEMIASVIGTIADRAEKEWQNIDCLSVVGLQALNAIGGWYYVKYQCQNTAFIRKDFIEAYCRLANGASAEDLEPPDPIALLEGSSAPSATYAYLPIGTKLNQDRIVETRWEPRAVDEGFNTKLFLDEYAARNIRLAEGIHQRAGEHVPRYWRNYANPNLEWLVSRAKFYAQMLQSMINESQSLN